MTHSFSLIERTGTFLSPRSLLWTNDEFSALVQWSTKPKHYKIIYSVNTGVSKGSKLYTLLHTVQVTQFFEFSLLYWKCLRVWLCSLDFFSLGPLYQFSWAPWCTPLQQHAMLRKCRNWLPGNPSFWLYVLGAAVSQVFFNLLSHSNDECTSSLEMCALAEHTSL